MRHLVLFLALLSMTALASPDMIVDESGVRHATGLMHRPNESETKGLGETHVTIDDCAGLPDAFDLADVGVTLPIRDQGQCGSCWAFSKTASLESSVVANGGALVDLSPQELVSCDKQNAGCSGGNLDQNEYQVTHGQGTAADFPYVARNTTCKQIPVKEKATSFVAVGQAGRRATDKEVQCALFKSHTIPWITVSADNSWGSFPKTEAPITRCSHGQTNHAIGITGWKTVNSKVYFRLRNSWGSSWGAKGTALMQLGCDNLGEEVSYVMTNVMPCKPPMHKLPISVAIMAGDEVVLAVNGQSGVSYTWTAGDMQVGTGSQVTIAPTQDTVYKVVGKNSCGSAESSTQVKVAH